MPFVGRALLLLMLTRARFLCISRIPVIADVEGGGSCVPVCVCASACVPVCVCVRVRACVRA